MANDNAELVEKMKTIDAALKKVNKKFGEGSAMRLDDPSAVHPVASRSSGLVGLDYVLGIGGLPKGRIVEVFGPEGSGKTTLCYTFIAETQRANGLCLYVDAEQSGDPHYAKTLGADFSKLIISQPSSGEVGLEIASVLMDTGTLDMVLVDSVAGLTTASEMEGDDIGGQKRIGGQAAMLSQSLRIIAPKVREHNVTMILTNQMRAKIGGFGGGFGPQETTPGGKSPKHWAKIRLSVRRGGLLGKTGAYYGQEVRIKTVKNNLAPPYKTWEGNLIWGAGFDKVADTIWLAKELNLLTRTGSTYVFDGERIAVGWDNTIKIIKENLDFYNAIHDRLRVIMASGEIIETPELKLPDEQNEEVENEDLQPE